VITLFVYVAFALFEHSNLAIAPRWFEQVFITPRLHRSHHVPSTSQRNFGTIFSFWDRALGTLTRRDTRLDEVLGVPGELDTYPQRFIAAAREPLSQTYAQRGTPANGRTGPDGPEAATDGERPLPTRDPYAAKCARQS
jgi:sterol desaturase/sphingolipid hydroxylase (fatty acid hydroxylase superfamily)